MLKNLIIAVVFIGTMAGCGKDSGFNCEYDPCKYPAPASQIADVQNYLTANGLTATQHCSGLFYKIISEGNGTAPTVCNRVVVSYEGKLVNGTVFDSNASIDFGLNEVITGWANGIPLIKPGGRILLYIPPYLGYGNQAQGNIPANSILIFDVTLTAVL
jgi:FKBP-type peptidyl-prolyl cis-trans isomerase FkpA